MSRKIITIAGGSGSGKTTVARALCERLGSEHALLVELDRFYHDHPHLSLEERSQLNYDHPASIDFNLLTSLLSQLLAGNSVSFPVYDFITHSRSATTERILPKPILVTEGIFALTNNFLTTSAHTKVFVETASEIRYQRRLHRDVSERGRTQESVKNYWDQIVEPMFNLHCAPSRSSADLVINGESPIDQMVDQILAKLK
jgi:uridine kinase